MRQLSLLVYCFFFSLLLFAQQPKDFMIPVKITMNKTLACAELSWPVNVNATAYFIKRKLLSDTSFDKPFATVGSITTNAATANKFTDTALLAGHFYEYEISGTFRTAPLTRSSYVCAGTDVTPTHKRGHLVLLCEQTLAAAIEPELNTFYKDLVGDGWSVTRIDVARSSNLADVVPVKEKIRTVYDLHHDLRQIIIVGHVPVPYSGAIWPDGHADHYGAWPADGYYGNLTSTFTDTAATTFFNSATRPETINRPGDGKFDQSLIYPVAIAVGRIDFFNMPIFNMTEADLTKRYLGKNHLFRHAETVVAKRALIEDNLLSFQEKFSQSAWKSYAAVVGYDSISIGQYETDLLAPQGYLWSYGTGFGSYNGISGINVTASFVTKVYKTVFTQLFGSYFGDWNTPNNYMKASIAAPGNSLTCVWGGRPLWFFHHMSAGYPIGYSALVTINNYDVYKSPGHDPVQAHIALMGDPSVRNQYTKPASNLTATTEASGVVIRWTVDPGAAVNGHYVYRSNSITGNFMLLTNEPVEGNSFTDLTPLTGNNVYMLRSYKIDTLLPSGSYSNNSSFYNLSQGIFDSLSFDRAVLPIPVSSFSATINDCSATLDWSVSGELSSRDYSIEYSKTGIDFGQVGFIAAVFPDDQSSRQYQFTHRPTEGKAFYRLKTVNNNGHFRYSDVVILPVNCSKSSVLVFPNPVKDFLNINLSATVSSNNVALLFDAMGRLLAKKILLNGVNKINMEKWPPGIYFLKVLLNGTEENFKIKK